MELLQGNLIFMIDYFKYQNATFQRGHDKRQTIFSIHTEFGRDAYSFERSLQEVESSETPSLPTYCRIPTRLELQQSKPVAMASFTSNKLNKS